MYKKNLKKNNIDTYIVNPINNINMEPIIEFFKKIPHYMQLFIFFLFHYCRLFVEWSHKNIIKPIESLLHKYKKKEPIEKQWIQLYCFTRNTYMNQYGVEEIQYISYDNFTFPYISNFFTFVENEHILFSESKQIELPYEYEFEQFAEPIETLFIAKNDYNYIVRTYNKNKVKTPLSIESLPKLSLMSFLFVEYFHPKMKDAIELKIPPGYYLEGNEILSPAFIHRILEYMNIYYVFDLDYEIRFLDDTMTYQMLKHDEYLEIKHETYERKSMNQKNIPTTIVDADSVNITDMDMEIIDKNTTETEYDSDDTSASYYNTPWLSFWSYW